MSGHFIWDAIVTLGIITVVLVALAAMTWWSITEVLGIVNRHLRPPTARWLRNRVRKVREWRRTTRR